MITTISYNQHELLRDILELHIKTETFTCDPTYGNGNFYKGTPKIYIPQHVSDTFPKFDFVKLLDCRRLTFPNTTIK